MTKRTFKETELKLDRKRFNAHLDRIGISQNELAKRMGFEHKQTLSKLLSGNRRMIIDDFVAMLRVLGVSPVELLRTLGFHVLSRQGKITAGLTAEGVVEKISIHRRTTVDIPVNAGEIGEIVYIDINQNENSFLFGSVIFSEPWRTARLADANRLSLIEIPKIGEAILGVIIPLRAGQIMIRNFITSEEITAENDVKVAPVIDWRFS